MEGLEYSLLKYKPKFFHEAVSAFLKFKVISILLLSFLFTLNGLYSQSSFSSQVFGDAYWIASNHNDDLVDVNGFRFRRIRLTYNQGLSESITVRISLEALHPGDYTTTSNMNVFIKDAYLKWGNGKTNLIVGMSITPTWSFIKDIWAYRNVEKTLMDLQRIGKSRDVGIALRGSLDQNNRIQYHLMLGNGNGTAAEINTGKNIAGSLTVEFLKNVFFQAYGDWNTLTENTEYYTLQGFLAYKSSSQRIGAQFVYQNRKELIEYKLRFVSVFASQKLNEKLWAFARVDHSFDPNPMGESIRYSPFAVAESTLILGGLDFTLYPNIHLIPNIEIVGYNKSEGVNYHTDIIPRITFSYKYN